jgi:hypothetical protein
MEYGTLPRSELIGVLRIALALVSCNGGLSQDDPTLLEFKSATSRLMAQLTAESHASCSVGATHRRP